MPLLKAPGNGVTIRMYRQGHGDCFLLAFPQNDSDQAYYVLIDCGYKPGSQNMVTKRSKKSIGDFVQHIIDSTNNTIDLMIITHEHQDHVNGIWKKNNPYFGKINIKKAWFAWTEDPKDPLAKKFRKKHKDQLLGLVSARNSLALALGTKDPVINRLDNFLNLELGGEEEAFNPLSAAAKDPTKSINKQAIKLIRDKADGNDGVEYLNPGDGPLSIEGVEGVKTYVLGPPRRESLLVDEDPIGKEGFPSHRGSSGLTFLAAASDSNGSTAKIPFANKFVIPKSKALRTKFFKDNYGTDNTEKLYDNEIEIASNAHWRRIDNEWLFSAETLALKLNRGINNTSLVLAFELQKSKKVLLFAGDAQRGNWISWHKNDWEVGDKTISAKDLISRTVLYKVGHHGSHNATLNGTVDSDYANLSWMGQGKYANEFTAMITAVNSWAMQKNNPPWRHPLPSIREALESKTQGRLFQTDMDIPAKPDDVSNSEWEKFTSNCTFDKMFFDFQILDEC